jgi:hypothetical protein
MDIIERVYEKIQKIFYFEDISFVIKREPFIDDNDTSIISNYKKILYITNNNETQKYILPFRV